MPAGPGASPCLRALRKLGRELSGQVRQEEEEEEGWGGSGLGMPFPASWQLLTAGTRVPGDGPLLGAEGLCGAQGL